MKRTALTTALLLSLAFNVFFTAGAMRAAREVPTDTVTDNAKTTDLISRELELSARQEQIFRDLQDDLQSDRAMWSQEMASLDDQLTAELAESEPNTERLRALLLARTEIQQTQVRGRLQQFEAFVTALDPEQCQRLAKRMRSATKRRDRRFAEHNMRFDTNGDGVLDDAERASAQRAMSERHERHRAERKQMLEQFDTNGDGHLDHEEREALGGAFKERRPRRPGGPGGRRDGRRDTGHPE